MFTNVGKGKRTKPEELALLAVGAAIQQGRASAGEQHMHKSGREDEWASKSSTKTIRHNLLLARLEFRAGR